MLPLVWAELSIGREAKTEAISRIDRQFMIFRDLSIVLVLPLTGRRRVVFFAFVTEGEIG